MIKAERESEKRRERIKIPLIQFSFRLKNNILRRQTDMHIHTQALFSHTPHAQHIRIYFKSSAIYHTV